MTYDLRLASADDGAALAQLSAECYGYPRPEPPYRDPQAAGRTTYVITHGSRIVATLANRTYDSWFWGVRVPTAAIASVKVAPEHRGNALLTPLFERALADAVDGGAVISTLFPTAPGIYRRFGYETFAALDEETVVPTVALSQVQTTGGSVRRGEVADVPAIRRLYEAWAAAYNGPLTRDGASFPATDTELVEAFPGMTIAYDDAGEPSGYTLWERTGGYGADGMLQVHDLVALTDQGMRLLLANLGTSATVAPRTTISTSAPDLAQLVLPADAWQPRVRLPYGIAVLDVAGALTTRRYPDWLDLDLTFAVTGLPVAGRDGAYRLRVSSGAAQVDRADEASTTYAARGFGLRFAGTLPSTELRRAGLLLGDAVDDSRWDAAFSGRPAHIRDYF